MKPIIAFLIPVFLFFISTEAQIIPVKNALQTDIAKVVNDFPNGFKNITGEEIKTNPQSVEYNSHVQVKEAAGCKVIKYSSAVKEIFSWEAEMMRTDDFEAAAKKFKTVYNSLQHLSADVNGTRLVFKGDYKKPSESIKFTTIVFDASDKHPEMKHLKISLVLEVEMLEWVIKIQVYEKEKEDNERGRTID
jgi:hypothetical protein